MADADRRFAKSRKASPCICATASACRSWPACPSRSGRANAPCSAGPSGAGKSSILKMLYGNYAADAGQIIVKHRDQLIDLASASPRTVLQVRRDTIGYVSQFLRTVPRVSALDVVAEPLVSLGEDREAARDHAREPACAPQPAGKALGPAARNLFRRRAAARQHRARLHHAASGAAARRADRLARREEPRSGRRADRRKKAARASPCLASSTTPTCARRSQTASST